MIGDVQQDSGKLQPALKSYQASLAIRQKLVAAEPGNAGWQRDLSVSHNAIGEVQQAQGKLSAAITSYQTGLAIRRKLAAAEPGNTSWQLDVAFSCWTLYQALPPTALATRRERLTEGLTVLRRLESEQRLPARAAAWPEMFASALDALK